LQDHPKITDRIKYSQLGVVTVELLKTIFGIENIYVGDAVYETDNGVVTDIWSDDIVLAYVPPKKQNMERSMYEPSYGYTLIKKGMPEIDTFDGEGGKIKNIRSTDNYTIKIVGSDAGYLIKDTCA